MITTPKSSNVICHHSVITDTEGKTLFQNDVLEETISEKWCVNAPLKHKSTSLSSSWEIAENHPLNIYLRF